MIIDDFKQKVVSQYWVKGGVWEFDWYLDVFFCEVMSYGDMPMHIGYEQAILGDNFLNPINWDESLKPFAGFFGNSDHVEDLIQKLVAPCETAIKDSGISKSELNEVVLVGGMTRMPKIVEAVSSFFGKEH